MWYRSGTVSITSGSTSVTGVGTNWIDGAGVGEAMWGPDGRLYEIANITSATSLTLGSGYQGATVTGGTYQIVPTQSYIRDLAAQAATLVADYGSIMSAAGQGKFGDGTVTQPGLRFTADENTGIRRVNSDTVAIVVGGADKVTVSPTGVSGITKSDVGLGNVDNTSDANKPVSTAQQAALDLKLNAANPSYTGTLTGGTGVINIGSGQLYKDSAGNFGFGVTPSAWGSGFKALEVGRAGSGLFSVGATSMQVTCNYYYNGSNYIYASNGSAARYHLVDGQHQWFTAPSGTAGNPISFTQAMTLDGSGNLIVGGALAGAAGATTLYENGNILSLFGSGTGGNVHLGAISGVSNGFQVTADTSNNLTYTWATGGAERARIDTSGNLLVGTISGGSKINVSDAANQSGITIANTSASFSTNLVELGSTRTTTDGTYNFIACAHSGVAYRFQVRDSGNVVNTNNSYGAISDLKLKENITDASPKLDKLMQVRIVNYNLKSDPDKTKMLGVVAQELEQISPGLIEETADRDKDGNDLGATTKSVKYSVFVPMLIKGMQEQQAQIEALMDRLAALEAA